MWKLVEIKESEKFWCPRNGYYYAHGYLLANEYGVTKIVTEETYGLFKKEGILKI